MHPSSGPNSTAAQTSRVLDRLSVHHDRLTSKIRYPQLISGFIELLGSCSRPALSGLRSREHRSPAPDQPGRNPEGLLLVKFPAARDES